LNQGFVLAPALKVNRTTSGRRMLDFWSRLAASWRVDRISIETNWCKRRTNIHV
jgi:hypothetical protein